MTMNLLGGGATYRGPDAQPPKPPPRASSSSFTLSPHAPPFKLDRPKTQPPPPFHPSSSSSPVPDGGASIQSASPYNPFYGSVVNDGVDLERAEVLNGVGGGAPRFGATTSYDPLSFQKEGTYGGLAAYEDTTNVCFGKHVNQILEKAPSELGCSEWFYNGHQPKYEENVAPQYDNFGASWLVPSASSTGTLYSYFPEPISVGISAGSSNLKSSDSGGIVHHDSCSVTPMSFYSPTTSPIPTLNTQSSTKTYSPSDRSTSRYECSRFHHDDMGSVDENSSAKARDPNIRKTIESKEGYCNRNRVDSHTDKFRGSSLLDKDSPVDELDTGNLMDSFRIKELSLSKSANSIKNSGTPNILMQATTETMDQDNLALDSPCWKGVSAPKHPLSCMNESFSSNVVMDSKCCCNLDQGQAHCPSGLYLALLEENRRMACDSNGENSSFPGVSSTAIGLSKAQKKFVPFNKSDDVENWNVERILNSENSKRQTKEISKVFESDSQAKDGVQLSLEAGGFAANHSLIVDGTGNFNTGFNIAVQDHSSDPHIYARDSLMNLMPGEIVEPVGSCSVSEKCSQSGDVQILIKAIYNLSQVLVSTNITNANEMKENDFELLQAVISNLEAFSSNKGKAARPLITIASDGNPSDGCSTHAKKNEMRSVSSILDSDKSVDYAACANNTNSMKQDKLITQAFERVLEKPPSQLKESPPWLLYKNLWIEAEVALCSMKRELQAARIEIVLNNQKPKCHDQLESLSDPSQMTKPVGPAMHGVPLTRDDAVKNKCGVSREPLPRNMNKGDDVDASVMARFSILKDRMEKTNPTCFEQQGAKENVSSLLSSSSIRPNAMDIFKPGLINEIMKEISDAPPPGVPEETEFGLTTTIASMKSADPPIVRICAPKPKTKSVSSLA